MSISDLSSLGGNNGPRLISLRPVFTSSSIVLSPRQARSRQSYQGLGSTRPSEMTDVINKYLFKALVFV